MSEAQPTPPPAPEGGMRRQLSQAVAWNAVFTPIKFIIDIISNLIKVNLLTRAELGTVTLVSAASNTAGIWLDLGIDQTLPKFIPEAEAAAGRGAARRFLRLMIALKLGLIALSLVALPLWGGAILAQIREGADAEIAVYGREALAPLLEQLDTYSWVFLAAIAALVVLGAIYDTLLAYLVSFFRQKAWNIINAFATLALPVLTVAAVLLGWGVVGVLAAMVTTSLLSVLVTANHVRRINAARAEEAASAPVPKDIWKRFVPYTAMAFLISATDYFSSNYFASLVVGLDGVVDVAIFTVAYAFIKQIQAYVYTPLRGIQVPLFARLRASGDQNLARAWGTLFRLVLVLVVPAATGLALLLPNLIIIQYREYADSIIIGLALIPFLFTEPLWGLGHNVLMVHEVYRPIIVSRVCALISLPLMVVLPPMLGLVGIVIAIGSSKLLAGLVVMVAALRRFELGVPWRFLGKVLACSAAMAAVTGVGVALLGVVPTEASITVRLAYFAACIALTLLGGAVFIGAARLIKLIDGEDRALIEELRNPLARKLVRVL